MELKPNKQIDRRGLPLLTNICSSLGASEAQILGTKDQRLHRGHTLLQSEAPVVPNHSRDSMAAVSSIFGIDRLYATAGLEDKITPPRKPDNSPRQVIRIGLPKTEATTSWISSNQLLQQHSDLAEQAATILTPGAPRPGFNNVPFMLNWMHIGNDIPQGEAGSGLKWCPLRNEVAYTACTVTRVTARRSTRGHCRQDIPLGIYDRKQQRWTLKDKTDEITYLLHLARKGDYLSLTILDRIRSAPWNSRSPNLRMVREKCEIRAAQWQHMPQSPSTSPLPSPRNKTRRGHSATPDWHALIWSSLTDHNKNIEAQRSTITGDLAQVSQEACTSHEETSTLLSKGDRSAALRLLHPLSSDPNGQAEIHTFFKDLEEKGHASRAREGRTIIRRVITNTDEAATGPFQQWIHRPDQ